MGTLTAVGAPGQEILFTKNTATDWSYLYFTGSGGGTFANTAPSRIPATESMPTPRAAISVSNVTLQNNSYGINAIATATMSVSDCQFQDNTYGIYISGGSIDLGSITFTGNTTYGYLRHRRGPQPAGRQQCLHRQRHRLSTWPTWPA